MQFPSKINHGGQPSRLAVLVVVAAVMLFLASPVFGQQTYVTRFDMFTGYTFLDSPHVSLFENGFHYQFGVRPRTWYSLGFDYSISAGDLTVTPNLLTDKLQQQLGPQLQFLIAHGVLPPGYQLSVVAHSRTQTATVGPQLAYRHFSKVTLFLRPSIGMIFETATPNLTPSDPFATGVVQQLAPSGKKKDHTPFYGFGGGIDFLFSNHVALRVQADLVRDHLFDDVLKDSRWTTRFSVGPCFNFGQNIAKGANAAKAVRD